MRIVSVVFLLVLLVSYSHAQLSPLPGAELNYNQVLLEHPASRMASAYIAQITDITDSAFARPLQEIQDSFNATIVSDLEFGKSYLWRYRSVINGMPQPWMGPYNFTILPDPYQINRDMRVHVLQNDSLNNAAGLILVDEFHCIFNRGGNLVWFMPEVKSGFRKGAETFDLSISPAGTITVLTAENGVELNLTGQILWMTPFKGKDTLFTQLGTFYNHDFKRLPDNDYMVIGRQFKWKKIPEDYDIYKIPLLPGYCNLAFRGIGRWKTGVVHAAGFFLSDGGGWHLFAG